MTDPKQFINQLTDKLRDDAELRMDVAQELQTHLEEAAADCRAAGMSEQQAMDHAIKVMGNPQELADQLFQANRRRMKLRAVARWAAGAALLPAAIVTIILLATLFGLGIPLFGNPGWTLQSQARNLPEDKQLLMAVPIGGPDRVARLKAICDRWPDDPVYYACYVTAALPKRVNEADSNRRRVNETNFSRSLPPETLSDILELLDKGQRLEPDNAYYNVYKAEFLFGASCTISEDESRMYDVSTLRFNTKGDTHPYKVEITNPTLFQQGLKEFHLAASKPVFTDHELDMLQRQMDLLPPSRHIRDILVRTAWKMSMLVPMMTEYRRCSRTVDAYALSMASREHAQALDLLGDAQRLNLRFGGQAKIIIPLLVANSAQTETLATQRLVHLEMNQPELAANDRDEILRLADVTTNIRKGWTYEDPLPHAGMLWSAVLPGGIPDYHVTFEPVRTAEGLTLAQVALLGLLAVLVLIALAVMLVNLVALLTGRRGMMVFVGWRRIGRICLWAIVVPLLAYGAYYAWQVYNPNAMGLNFAAGRVALEMSTVPLIVLFLLMRMSHHAIRRRCEELGLPTTSGKRWPGIAAMGLLVAAALTYVIKWWVNPQTSTIQLPDVIHKIIGDDWFWGAITGRDGNQTPGSEVADQFLVIGVVGVLLITVLLVVLLLLVRDLYRKTREKHEKSGQPFPARRRWPLLVGMGLVIAVTGPLLFGILVGIFTYLADQGDHGQQGLILAGLLLAVATGWGLASFFCMVVPLRRNREFTRTFFRSLVPILCAAVIVVGVLCGGLLAYAETSAARRVVGPADLDFRHEVDASGYRHLRDYFAQQLNAMPAGPSSRPAGGRS